MTTRGRRDVATQTGGATPNTATQVRGIDVTKPGGWQRALLAELGAPNDPGTLEGRLNIQFVDAWARAEGTKARYNPLATSKHMPGSSSFNSVGVQNYATPADGVRAMAATIRSGYPHIEHYLKAGDPAGILTDASPLAELNKWVTGHLAPPPAGWSYAKNISSRFYAYKGSASDWTSFDLKDAAGAASNAAGAAAGAAKDAASAVAAPFVQIANAVVALVKTLLSMDFWRRVGQIIGGGVLVAGGLFVLVKSQAA